MGDLRKSAASRSHAGRWPTCFVNRFYVGEVAFKGEILAGEQLAIVDRDLFDPIALNGLYVAVSRPRHAILPGCEGSKVDHNVVKQLCHRGDLIPVCY
jgi:hypothetical protein